MNTSKDLLNSLFPKPISPDLILNAASQIVIGEEYLKMEVWANGTLFLRAITFLEVNGDTGRAQVGGDVVEVYLESMTLLPRRYENGHRLFKRTGDVEKLLRRFDKEQNLYGYLMAIGLSREELERFLDKTKLEHGIAREFPLAEDPRGIFRKDRPGPNPFKK